IPSLGRLQTLSQTLRHSRTESPRHYPDDDLVVSSRVAAWVSEAPAYGIVSYPIDGGDANRARPKALVIVKPDEMQNAALRVVINGEGRVSPEHLGSGRRIESLLDFVDETDLGDLYTPSPRPVDHSIRFRGVRRVHRGPLRGELALRYRVTHPSSKRAAV